MKCKKCGCPVKPIREFFWHDYEFLRVKCTSCGWEGTVTKRMFEAVAKILGEGGVSREKTAS